MPATMTLPATPAAARWGLVDATGHAFRNLSFPTERAASQYLDRLTEKSRRALRTGGYKVGPVETTATPCCDPSEPAPCTACATTHAEPPAVAEERPIKASPSRPADVCSLVLTIRGDDYRVRGIPAEAFGATARAYRLAKVGAAEAHHVAETPHGPTCDCPDQTFRHEGRDGTGCKHIRALRALGLVR